jgi:drug/metabolite transporter (DMT)-like permease
VAAVVILSALAAAILYGSSAALEHHAVATATADVGALRRAVALLRNRWWLFGKLANGLALIFQALALSRGPLIATQAILSTGLFFAVAAGAALRRRWLEPRDVVAALVLGAGIALLLVVGRPVGRRAVPTTTAWIGVTLVCTAAVVVGVSAARDRPGVARAALLGGCAGLTFALDSALLKAAAEAIAGGGIVHGITRWETPAFVAVVIVGELLVQRAFAAGPLSASLPALTATEPAAAVVMGMALYRERLASAGWAPTLEVVAAALIAAGVLAMTRTEGQDR